MSVEFNIDNNIKCDECEDLIREGRNAYCQDCYREILNENLELRRLLDLMKRG